MEFELIATTTFGIEAVCKRELIDLGYKIVSTENGKVTFLSDEAGIARANLWVRTADRILLKVGEYKVNTFDELFDQTKVLNWGAIIPIDGKFIVNAKSVKSKLFSLRDCQKIVKKAIVEKMKFKYKVDWLEETGAEFSVLVSILKDVATLTIDTSGVALHKRGYRVKTVDAPLKETLAASLVLLSYYKKDRILYDVFCGSGTIPIEAAMIAKNIAPGLNRDFASQDWPLIGEKTWKEERKKAFQAIDNDVDLQIFASDISGTDLSAAKENAEAAGVDDCITFEQSDFRQIEYKNNYAILISNPPYGARLNDEKYVKELARDMGKLFKKLDTWSMYFLTAYMEFEAFYNKGCNRKRKLYNGRIETWYYQYYGPRPPREE